MRVLLVEDDASLGEALAAGLRHAGHAVDWVRDSPPADAAVATTAFDAIVLDLGLPRGSGLDLLRGWRARGRACAVLIVTARDRIADRIAGLDAGADDYMVKPVDLDELAARLRALARRGDGKPTPLIELGSVTIDPAGARVSRGAEEIALTAREFALLLALARRPSQTLSVEQLREALYGFDDEVDSNTVGVHIHHLRRKLGRGIVRTHRGFGYQIGHAD
jgi:DNA-binding response OmpR family regulator